MKLPGFNAEVCLRPPRRYVGREAAGKARSRGVVPAIPFCGNCDYILDHCSRNGFRPRALCLACLTGNCFSGVEHPPSVLQNPPSPFGPFF